MWTRFMQLSSLWILMATFATDSTPLLEVKPLRGVDFTLQNSPTVQKYLIETMPGGVALLDYNNDGLLDIFLVNGGQVVDPMKMPENFDRHEPLLWNRLFRQNKDGTFTDVTSQAGLADAGDGNYGMGVAVGDYDNDGYPDIYVTNYGKNTLYHNNGDGTFTDVSQRSGIAAKKGRALGVAFSDYDEDGFTDVFVSNDGMQQFLFHNNGNGTFTERGLEAGAALSQDGRRISGMGVVFQDYDNDGRPDIIVTELPREIYGVYHNDGNGSFSYRSLETGLGTLSSGSSGWGVGLEDFDNDGWKDLFVAQSHVLDNVEQIDPSLHYKELPLLALNHSGRFERGDSGIDTAEAGRGAAFGDLNNDGSIDVVMTTLSGSPQLYLNRGSKQHWLTLTLRGTRSNRDGYGARVQVNGQTRFATSA